MRETQSLYIDLYEKLKKQIIEGQYQSNDRFPSKRQLSEHLSLSQTTIEHAYQLLLDEGFIYSNPDQVITYPISNHYLYFPNNMFCPQLHTSIMTIRR